jgi:hypothetical protein
MKQQRLSLVFAALALTAAATASAQVRFSVGVNQYDPYGEYRPPVVYQPAPYYSPPPVVYYGRGSWGDRRRYNERHYRDRGYERDHQDRGYQRDHGDHNRQP